MLSTRSERRGYFEPILGALSPAPPILGAFEAFVGQYRGQPVWVFFTKEAGRGGQPGSLWIAMSIGHPIEGSIATDFALRKRPPVSDAEFFHVFHLAISPGDVAPLALDTPATRAHVQRAFRGGGGMRVLLNEGYLWTDADFRQPPHMMSWREPSREEVHALVEDVAHLTERFRVAFETRYAEVARTQGDAAAQAWYARAQAGADLAQEKAARWQRIGAAATLGCVGVALLCIAVLFFWFLPGR